MSGLFPRFTIPKIKIPKLKPVKLFRFPFKKNRRITSLFGWRIHPVTGKKQFHSGIDISAPVGTPILSIGDGRVVAMWHDTKHGGGLSLRVKHDNDYQSGYAHIDKYNSFIGHKVSKGEQIAESGMTGIQTGPHLHLSVRNPESNLIDPLDVINI